MYYFKAIYTNMTTLKDRTVTITVSEYGRSERDCYICAMTIAIDMLHKDESLSALEFISC